MTKYDLYKDSVIQVRIATNKKNSTIKSIELKYLSPENYVDKKGNNILVVNEMGGETDWFILPHTFGIVIGKTLFEQYCMGLKGFDNNGIKILKEWLIDFEAVSDSMCY